MEEKCQEIDTSSKNIEVEENIKNYQNLDIISLEKEFEKTKKKFEKEQQFKKAKNFK